MPTTTAARRDGSSGAATPSARTPASLRPPDEQVVGPLQVGRDAGDVSHGRLARREGDGLGRAVRATRAVGAGRSRIEHSSDAPGGACHVRPRRPRPAVWWSATSTVPAGAPARAAATRSALVEPVSSTQVTAKCQASRAPKWGGGRRAHGTNIRPRAPEDPDRQPGRDRRSGHPCVPRARHRHRRRLLRARPQRAPRPPGRRGLRPRRADRGRELPQHRGHPRRDRSAAAPTACTRATASSPRTPTSPGPSPSGRRLHRAAARGHRRDGRQGLSRASPPCGPASPCVPGTTEFLTDPDEVRAFGDEHGWPVAIKAAFGGGGRGMKVVSGADEVEAAIESAQREAKAYFGRDEIYVERYLTWPRHVEMQIIGDQHGQRGVGRRARLLGAAPPPEADRGEPGAGLPRRRRARPWATAAVKVAKAVGYYNAGTVEFIYQDGEFFFLEMNTRLQVEHPVTEMVTGIDLVEWQIRVASGEPLSFDARTRSLRSGAATPSRSASTPRTRPAAASCRRPGTITKLVAARRVRHPLRRRLREPATRSASTTTTSIGKLIVWGKDRPTAIARAIRALEEMVVEGVATTIPADLAILRHPDFAAGDALDQVGRGAPRPHRRRGPAKPPQRRRGRRPSRWSSGRTTVEVNGKRFAVKLWVPESAPAAVVAGGGPAPAARKPARAASAAAGGRRQRRGRPCRCRARSSRCSSRSGQAVEVGQAVVVLEAMKMENQIDGREGRHGQGDQGRRRRHRRRRRRRRRHRVGSHRPRRTPCPSRGPCHRCATGRPTRTAGGGRASRSGTATSSSAPAPRAARRGCR